MKNKLQPLLYFGLVLLLNFFLPTPNAHAQSTAFSYQGHLNDNGAPATGIYELEFYLRDSLFGSAPVGVTNDLVAVPVTNGVFSVTLDFGAAAFPGADRWLELGVRTNGSSADFDILSPRQKLLPVPYALHAAQADIAASLSGSALNQPLVINVNNNRALRLEPTAYGFPNFIIGSIDNSVDASGMGDTISGGDANTMDVFGPYVTANYSFIGGGYQNHIQNSDLSVITGGDENIITNAPAGVISGGEANQIKGDSASGGPSPDSLIAGGQNNRVFYSQYSAIGGGANNRITNATEAFLGGGSQNVIGGSGIGDTIGGGNNNTILVGDGGFIGGGYLNQIGDGHGNPGYATIPGGYGNLALGAYSFAAGLYAQATNLGSFVWSDGMAYQFDKFSSVVNNEFAVRARGGVRFVTGGAGLWVDGFQVNSGGSGGGSGVTHNINNATFSTINGGVYNSIQSNADYSTIGGGTNNLIDSGVSFIGGGTMNFIDLFAYGSTIGGGYQNIVSTNQYSDYVNYKSSSALYSTIGGGIYNGAGGYASTVGGGYLNHADGFASTVAGGGGEYYYILGGNLAYGDYSSVGGGYYNHAMAYQTTIGGGGANLIASNALMSTISGGDVNSIQINAAFATISGGTNNSISTNASWGAIGGGGDNVIRSATSAIGGGIMNVVDLFTYGSTIGGGYQNAVSTNLFSYGSNYKSFDANFSTIGGGIFNGAGGYASTIGGGYLNRASGFASTVAGGGGDYYYITGGNLAAGSYSSIGGGFDNRAIGYASSISGGSGNFIETNSVGSGTGGGLLNDIQAGSVSAWIGGGSNNIVGSNTFAVTIAGGQNNLSSSSWSAIGGGHLNTAGSVAGTIGGGENNGIGTNAYASTIGGGSGNVIADNATAGIIPGGVGNSVLASYGFAAGRFAAASHQGAFVWADSTGGTFGSTAANQFLVRASGGVGIGTASPQGLLHVAQNDTSRPQLLLEQNHLNDFARIRFRNSNATDWDITAGPGYFGGAYSSLNIENGGTILLNVVTNGFVSAHAFTADAMYAASFNTTSDRNVKENFQDVSAQQVLAKVAALPISRWNFKKDKSAEHIGPMAQDFYAAFGVGSDDKHIATVDEDGVALAAIQGLNQKLNEKDAEIQNLKQSVAELKSLVQVLAEKK